MVSIDGMYGRHRRHGRMGWMDRWMMDDG